MGFEVNNPFLYQLREGSVADPFVDKVESLRVVDGRLLLSEMPVKQNGVLVDGHTEIDTNTPTGTQFYVDYTNGTVYFVSTKNATVTARYKGRGLVQIPSERIYHKKGSVTRTLDTIVETVDTSAIAASNAASLANAKATAADNAATAASTQADYAKTQGDYAKQQGDRVDTRLEQTNTAEQNAITATTNAVAATQDVLNSIAQVTNQGTQAGQAAAQATSQADYAKAQGDYAKAQGDAAKAAVVGTITNKAVTSAKLDDDVQVGSLKTLKTDVKTSVTGALNEIFEDVTKSVLGSKLTSTTLANFVGKIAGSTTANPHTVKYLSQTALITPANFFQEAAGTVSYSGMQSLDGQVSFLNNASQGNISQMLFSFNLIEQIQRQYGITLSGTTADKVTWLKANLSKLTFNWHGYGSSATGNKSTVAVWNAQTSQWSTMGSHLQSSVFRTQGAYTGGGITNLLDTSGFFHGLAYAEPSDGVTPSIINTDYAELLVELKTDILSSLPVATTTTPGVMSPADKLTLDNGQKFKLTDNDGANKVLTNYDTSTMRNRSNAGTYTTTDLTIGLPSKLQSFERYGTLQVLPRDNGSVQQIFYSFEGRVFHRYLLSSSIYYPSYSDNAGWIEFTTVGKLASAVMGNKFVDQSNANFVGKVAGSTTANPHIAKAGYANSLVSPSGFSYELLNADYNAIFSIGGAPQTTGSSLTSGTYALSLFSFNLIEHVQRTYGTIPGATTADKVAWLKGNLSKLTFNWFGFGSSPTGSKATVNAWRNDLNAWNDFKMTSGSSVPSKINYVIASPLQTYIDTNGFAHFLAYAEASDGTTASVINTDYVELQVELSTDIKTNLPNATIANTAADITITDTANYYTSPNVEGALQEIGQTLAGTGTGIVATLRTNQETLLSDVGVYKKVLNGNQQTAIVDLTTDKSLYRPTERVIFSAYLSGSLGTIETTAYRGDKLVYSEKVAVTKPGHVSWQWYLPDVDKVGYLVRVTYERPDGVKQTEEIAVHVDNNWTNFPIYGFLSQFQPQHDKTLEENMNRLKRRHINGIQYYDWFDRHHMPLMTNDLGMSAQFWLDIGKRPTQIDTIKRYIQLAQRANIASMQYNLIYGAATDQKVDGLTEEMFLYINTEKTGVLKQVLTPWAKNDLFLMNPLSEAWQTYIIERMARVYDFLNFDGWHVDQLGKLTDASYSNLGGHVDWGTHNEGFGHLLKKAKERNSDKLLVMNAVSNYAHTQILQSGVVAFAYTEVWNEAQTYQQLRSLIDGIQAQNGNAPVVIAGYMNYDYAKANETGRFNEAGVLLMDAICFANGATRIELGEHLLENEYFPQHHLTTDHFDARLTKYYDFLVAYRPFLTRLTTKSITVASTTENLSTSFEAGKVTYLVKENATHVVVHLINLTGITDVNWRDTNANKPRPTLRTNVNLTIPVTGKTAWYASADGETLGASTLDGAKSSYTVTLPKLDIWSMVVIEK